MRKVVFWILLGIFLPILVTGTAADVGSAATDPMDDPEILNFESDLSPWSIRVDGGVPYEVSDANAHGGGYALKTGPSTCLADCSSDYRVVLERDFNGPTFVSKITLWVLEEGNWGGKIKVFADGENLGDINPVSNDAPENPVWIQGEVSVGREVTTLEIASRDITTQSVLYLDDIAVFFDEPDPISNNPPVADPGVFETNEDTEIAGILIGSDPDGDTLTYSIVSNGSRGTATITDTASGAFTYSPAADEYGVDTFTFQVNDGSADSEPATVTVTIHPAVCPGDIDNSGIVNLVDALLALQIVTEKAGKGTFYKSADINGDGRISIEEAVFALQATAGLRDAMNPQFLCRGDDENAGIYRICNCFPLSPGNLWTYTTGDRFIQSETYTNASGLTGIRFASNVYEYEPFLAHTENGLEVLAQIENPEGTIFEFNPPFSLLPAAMKIGETMNKTLTWPDSSETIFATTLVGKETLTVPAGIFETLKIKIEINDVGKCQYTTWLWLAKNIGMIKIHRTNPSPSDCTGCMFVCRPDNDLSKLNAPAELVSASVNGTVIVRESYNMTFYYPLAVGNLWNYDDGKQEVTAKNMDAYTIIDTGSCNEGDQLIFTNDENGLQLIGVVGLTFSAPIKYANKYAKVGDELTSTFNIVEEGKSLKALVRFIGVESVDVPAGYFPECLKFSQEIDVGEANDDYHKTYLWFAKDIGIVKMERYDFQPPESQGCIMCLGQRELRDFIVK